LHRGPGRKTIEAFLSKRKRYLSLLLRANPYALQWTIMERFTSAKIAGPSPHKLAADETE
jgi:hypothetical protein